MHDHDSNKQYYKKEECEEEAERERDQNRLKHLHQHHAHDHKKELDFVRIENDFKMKFDKFMLDQNEAENDRFDVNEMLAHMKAMTHYLVDDRQNMAMY